MAGPLVVSASVSLLVLLAGAAATRVGPWFWALRKPRWNPPDWLFGPMWTTIAILAIYAAAEAWTRAPDDHTRIATLFGLNAVLNAAWSPLFFILKRPDWALIEVVFLWVSTVALVIGLAPSGSHLVWFLVPYLGWVSIAAVLNFEIVRLNTPFGSASVGR